MQHSALPILSLHATLISIYCIATEYRRNFTTGSLVISMHRNVIHILLAALIITSTVAGSGSLIICYSEGDHLAVETGTGDHCSHHADFTKRSTHTFADAYSHRHGVHIDLPLSFLDSSYLNSATGIAGLTHPPAITIHDIPSTDPVIFPVASTLTPHHMQHLHNLLPDFHCTTVLLS